jgi:hypothetical protein
VALLPGPERADKGLDPLQEQNVHSQAVNNVARTVSGGPGREVPPGARTQANYTGDAPRLVDPAEDEFLPQQGSALVDSGTVLPGVTDGYSGQAPDIGAYERGEQYWRPGADWLTEWEAYLAERRGEDRASARR